MRQKSMLGQLPDLTRFPWPSALWPGIKAGNLIDLSGNRNDGTFNGGPQWVPGKFGWAVKYSSVSYQYIEIPHSSSITFGTNDFTISIWFKSVNDPADSHPSMIGKGDTGAGEWMCRLQNQVNVGMYLNAGAIDLNTSGTDYSDDQWHHAVFVRRGDNLYIYVDGVLAASGSGVGPSDLNDTTSLRIGNADGDNARYWDGLLGISLIWNGCALTASQIAQLYQDPFPWFVEDEIGGLYVPGAPPTVKPWWYYQQMIAMMRRSA